MRWPQTLYDRRCASACQGRHHRCSRLQKKLVSLDYFFFCKEKRKLFVNKRCQASSRTSAAICTSESVWNSSFTFWIVKIMFHTFILFFWFLVFWSLWLCDFLSGLFPSYPSCLAKCKQRSCNIFVTSLPKVTKNQKWKNGMKETYVCSDSYQELTKDCRLHQTWC